MLMLVKSVRELMLLGSKEPSECHGFLFYCTYCSKHCDSQQSLDNHCQTPEHDFNVTSDKQHQWNYRSPPWTTNGHFSLCQLYALCIVSVLVTTVCYGCSGFDFFKSIQGWIWLDSGLKVWPVGPNVFELHMM